MGGPTLRFESDAYDTRLETREADAWRDRNRGWRPLCVAPCAIPILAGYEFRAVAPGKVASTPFMVGWGSTNAYATMGSRPARTTGIVLTAVGGAVGGIGLTMALLMSSKSGELGNGSPEDIAVALGAGGLGAAAFAIGLVLMGNNRSSVTLSSPSAPGFALAPGGFVF
jgi:hypothetical protein